MYEIQFSILLDYLCKNIFISNPDCSFWSLKLKHQFSSFFLSNQYIAPTAFFFRYFLECLSLLLYSCLCILCPQLMHLFFREQLSYLINVCLIKICSMNLLNCNKVGSLKLNHLLFNNSVGQKTRQLHWVSV